MGNEGGGLEETGIQGQDCHGIAHVKQVAKTHGVASPFGLEHGRQQQRFSWRSFGVKS